MRRLFALSFFLASASTALAQSPGLEKACAKVAKDFNLAATITLGTVQSFPELSPPGVRLTYSTDRNAKPEEIDDQLECEFDSNTAPFGLKRFCFERTCYSPDSKDPAERRRFEEIRLLMERSPA